LPAVRRLLVDDLPSDVNTTETSTSVAVATLASAFQASASDKRIGIPRPPNLSLQKALQKSAAIVDERRKKKKQSPVLNPDLIRIAAGLWQISDIQPGTDSKMTKVRNSGYSNMVI